MPLLRNKFQPYFPDPDAPNNYQCGSERYCHPVTVGDTVWSQFYQTPCNENEVEDPEFDDYTFGADLVTDGDFSTNPTLSGWNLGTGWSWDNVNFEMDFTPGTVGLLTQTLPGLVLGQAYNVSFDVTRTAGSLQVGLGLLVGLVDYTPSVSSTGSYNFTLIFNDTTPSNDIINVLPSIDFNGSIDNIKVEAIIYTYWDTNDAWILGDGQACHIPGQTGDLKEIVADYIDANAYYKISFNVSGRADGSLTVKVSDVSTSAVTTNGDFTFWLTPTMPGTITIEGTSTFDGCISDIALYKLRNDYSAELIDSDGNINDVSDAFSYYEDYVTLGFSFDNYELGDDCYTLNVYDQCVVTSDNLVMNGDFANGFTDWTKNNSNSQYAIIGDQLELIFNPFGIGSTDYVTNGDFSSGSTGWTLGAGWSIVGNAARHTAGNTATLSQTLTLPAPPLPATGYNYWVGFTVSNWTTGTVSLKLGNAPTGTTYTWKGNDIFIQIYSPKQSGSVDITFTPSSTFDGDIDDIKVVMTNHSAFPILKQDGIATITPGTYQTDFEIMGSTDANISARAYLNGGVPVPNYQSAFGTYSFTQTYTLNGGNYYIIGNFSKTDPNYIQPNYIEGSIIIDNVSLKKIEPFEATYQSECIQYAESFDRSKVMVSWCDQNALGFEFENTGFRLTHRLEIRSINPIYPSTSEIMKTGRGNDRFVYGQLEKFWNVYTGFASETFHDLMAAMLVCDHIQIGDTASYGTEYTSNGQEYAPEWNGEGAYSLAPANFQLRVKEKGQQFNRHI